MKRKRKSKLAKRKADDNSTYWKKRADQAWSQLIRSRAICEIGATTGFPCAGTIEAAHLISRACLATRHDPMNGLALCSLHHNFDKRLSYHGAPIAFTAWLQTYLPDRAKWVLSQPHVHEPGSYNFREAYERLSRVEVEVAEAAESRQA